jgi:hypothetical protein
MEAVVMAAMDAVVPVDLMSDTRHRLASHSSRVRCYSCLFAIHPYVSGVWLSTTTALGMDCDDCIDAGIV